MIKYDYSFLRGKIKEKYGSEKAFAEKLNETNIQISKTTFSYKINNNSSFKQSEIDIICELLNIPKSELETYFFRRKYELNS